MPRWAQMDGDDEALQALERIADEAASSNLGEAQIKLSQSLQTYASTKRRNLEMDAKEGSEPTIAKKLRAAEAEKELRWQDRSAKRMPLILQMESLPLGTVVVSKTADHRQDLEVLGARLLVWPRRTGRDLVPILKDVSQAESII